MNSPRRLVALFRLTITLTILVASLVTSAVPGRSAERRAADMPADWRRTWSICDQQTRDSTPDQRIAACTTIISLGEKGNPNKIVYDGGFYGRARAYFDNGQYSKAITDFNTTIDYSRANNLATNVLLMRPLLSEDEVKERRDAFQQELRGDIAIAKGDYVSGSKYPPAEPGALGLEPLKAAIGVANAAPWM